MEISIGAHDEIYGKWGHRAATLFLVIFKPQISKHVLNQKKPYTLYGGLSKLWSLFGSPKLGPVLGPVL